MTRIRQRLAAALLLACFALAGSHAAAQVSSLFYKEIEKDGRVYVFNTIEKYKSFQTTGDMGVAISLIGHGPKGETIVAENETALDLYNLKHDRPAYERAAAKPAAPAGPPTSLKIGDGEIKIGALLQAWYVTDDSPVNAATTSYYGNTTGENTFRLRRAEIRLSGTIVPGWGFEVMFDPAKAINTAAGQDGKILQDLGVSFTGLKGHELTLGQKKIYLTEDGVHSSSDLDFAERPRVTRGFSDKRETGIFWKADWAEQFTSWVSVTNGTLSNAVDDSNDTVLWSGRLDFKPIKNLNVGGSGSYSGGEALAHLTRSRYGVHVRYDRTADLPVDFRFEYLVAKDGRAGTTDLRRSGFYGTLMYTLENRYQLAVRYDEINNNRDVANNKIKTFTGGFHYLVKGRNCNAKLDWYHVKEEGRKINNVLEDSYNQVVLAAQVAF